mgnify:CR=1 FL=1
MAVGARGCLLACVRVPAWKGEKLAEGERVKDKVDRRGPEPRQTSRRVKGENDALGKTRRAERRPGRMLDCLAAALSTHAFESLRFNF